MTTIERKARRRLVAGFARILAGAILVKAFLWFAFAVSPGVLYPFLGN